MFGRFPYKDCGLGQCNHGSLYKKATMIVTTLVCEDCRIFATRDAITLGLWSGRSEDAFSGKIRHFEGLTDQQMGLIVFMTHCGGEQGALSTEMFGELYRQASELVKDWPRECRPFP